MRSKGVMAGDSHQRRRNNCRACGLKRIETEQGQDWRDKKIRGGPGRKSRQDRPVTAREHLRLQEMDALICNRDVWQHQHDTACCERRHPNQNTQGNKPIGMHSSGAVRSFAMTTTERGETN